MTDSPPVAVSAVCLTAGELAACVRAAIPLTDLAILTLSPGESYGMAAERVREALDAGYYMVWQLHPEEQAVTIHPSWTHLRVFRAHQELAMEEMPYFRCRVDYFFRLLEMA